MGRLILLLLALASPAAGQEAMTGSDFAAYTKGRTLTFALPDGSTHGVEQYLPNKRVIWSPAPGTCVIGKWYAQDGDICFVYENDDEPKCWRVYRTPRGIRADFTNTPGSTILFEAIDSPEPLICPGPELLG